MRSLAIGANGMLAQQTNVDVIANNIANMSTNGFKRQRAEFQDLLYQTQRGVGTESSAEGTIVPSGIQLGVGVRLASTYRIHEDGSNTPTGNELDMLVQGEGFFQIQLPNGDTAYTRDGSFQRSPDGQLVTADGYTIQPGITIPEDALSVTINANGSVFAKIQGQMQPQNIGTIEVARFINSAGLEAIGSNSFLETPASGQATTGTPGQDGFGTILQGYLETSNVNAVQEITDLIQAQRAYEMNSKVIQTSDEMLGVLNQTT